MKLGLKLTSEPVKFVFSCRTVAGTKCLSDSGDGDTFQSDCVDADTMDAVRKPLGSGVLYPSEELSPNLLKGSSSASLYMLTVSKSSFIASTPSLRRK